MAGRSPHFYNPIKVVLRGIGFSLWGLVLARTKFHRLEAYATGSVILNLLGEKMAGTARPGETGTSGPEIARGDYRCRPGERFGR
jgi:hypothetical protein